MYIFFRILSILIIIIFIIIIGTVIFMYLKSQTSENKPSCKNSDLAYPECTSCKGNDKWNPENCNSCKNANLAYPECTSCESDKWDLNNSCKTCINSKLKWPECENTCINNNFMTTNPPCTKCTDRYDIKTNCTTCLAGPRCDPNNNCICYLF